MAAEDLALPEIEAEFDPLVVIIAEDVDRFASFSAVFAKNDFKCEVYSEIHDEVIDARRPGTVYFLSFNLKSADSIAIARRLEAQNKICIVFAENEGFDTAAKLSSSRLPQTLQHPYTEKNFLMAVQTIVKKRRVQHEKDMRKLAVHERRKGVVDAQVAADEADRIFRYEASETKKASLIFQERVQGKGPRTKFIEGQGLPKGFFIHAPGRKSAYFSEIAKGLPTSKFSVVQGSVHAQELTSSTGYVTSESISIVQPGRVTSAPMPATTSGAVVQTLSAAEFGQVTKQSNSTVAQPTVTKASASAATLKPTYANEIAITTAPAAAKVKREGEVLIGYKKEDLRDGATRRGFDESGVIEKSPAGEVASSPLVTVPLPQPAMTKVAGNIAVPTWALIAAASIGILFCFFFLYQIMFADRVERPRKAQATFLTK